MNMNIQNRIIHHVIPVILALFIFALPLFCFTPSASAQGLDYTDYIVGITENENGESVVTMEYPLNAMYSHWYLNDKLVGTGTNTIDWEMRDNNWKYAIVFYSCPPDSPNVIDTTYIPSGSLVVCELQSTLLVSSQQTPFVNLYVIPVGQNGKDLSGAQQGPLVTPNFGGTTTVQCVFNKVPDATAFRFQLYYGNFSGEYHTDVNQRTSITRCLIKMTISSLVVQQAQSGKTNEILKAVEQKLEENGQKLDDVLSGESLNDHNVNAPGGFNDKVNQQQNQVQQGMADINKVDKPDPNSAIPDIGSYVPAEGANSLSIIMGGITGFSIVPTYLMIVVGLFMVSFIMFGKKEN